MDKKVKVPQRTLYDTRDSNTYTVRKLADGNVWMTENLRLGSTSSTLTLTPSDSNVSSNFILPIAQTSISDSWGDASNTNNEKHIYATSNNSYGNYYNWYTATAGTGLGTMSSASAANLTNAPSSICAKGWRLPDGGTSASKSWYAFDIALGGNGATRTDTAFRDKLISSPYDFPYSGLYNYGGYPNRQGEAGYWWTRSAGTAAGSAYDFALDNNGFVRVRYGGDPVGYGFEIRCLAQ